MLRLARRLGRLQRWLARRVLGGQFAAPPAFRPGRGVLGRLDARLRDGTAWRAVAYLLLKLPVCLVQAYVVSYWVFGLVNLSSPLWWPLLHHPPPGGPAGPFHVIVPLPAGQLLGEQLAGTLARRDGRGRSPCWPRRG